MAIIARPQSVRFIQMLRLAVLGVVAVSGFLYLRASYGDIAIYVVDIPLVALGLAYGLSWIWLRQTMAEDGSYDEQPLYLQILLDVLLMGLVVFYTGAASSTLWLVFLLPILLASAFLYLRGSLVAAVLSILLLGGIFFLDASGMLADYGNITVLIEDAEGVPVEERIYERYFPEPLILGEVTDPLTLADTIPLEILTKLMAACLTLIAAAFLGGYLAENQRGIIGEVSQLTRRLARIRLYTSDVMDNLESGLIMVEREGLVVFFNRAGREILQLEGPEPEGRNFEVVLAGRLEPLGAFLRQALEGAIASRRNEVEIILSDERRIPLGVTPSVLRDQEGIRGVVLIFQDITDVKLMEERMRRQDRLAAVGELAAGIAHELRNPLASIAGSAEVLQESTAAEGEEGRLLGLVLKESSRVNVIIEEFLNYTRIQPVVTEEVDVARVAEEVLTLARNHPSFGEGRTMKVELDGCPSVKADEAQLKQVLLNLVLNALEALEEGGEVIIRCPPDDEREPAGAGLVEVWVQDDGPGIAPGDEERIFEPFQTTKRGGTGLGLAVVQRIVESHEGHIRYAPSRDGRCTFRLYLPHGVRSV